MITLSDEDLALLQSQDPYHPSGPGRELSANEMKVYIKFFTPDANWTWYACSASKDENTGDIQFFGLVDGHEPELGYFWLSELNQAKGQLGLPIERDEYWKPVSLATVMLEVCHGQPV